MGDWGVYGHDWAVEYLRRGLANRRVRHAYLMTGPDSVGKHTLAQGFTRALQCSAPDVDARPCGVCRSCRLLASGNHPDVVYTQLDAGTGTLKIEEVRAVMGKLALKPFEARYRIAILSDFERARVTAQDALLKTLEEPPAAALLILLASSPDALQPTIVSRCQNIALTLLPADVVRGVLVERFGADAGHADLLARLSGGRLGWAIRALQAPETLDQRREALDVLESIAPMNRAARFKLADDLSGDRLALYPLLDLWQTYWRDVLLHTEGTRLPAVNSDRPGLAALAAQLTPGEALEALKATRAAQERLRQNVNVRLALEVLLLAYPGLKR